MTAGSHGLTQAYEIRDLAAKHALELNDTPASDLEERASRAQALRNLATVWDTACERIRILRGRPLPGSLRPKSMPPAKGKRQTTAAPRDGVDYAENGEQKPTVSIPTTETVYPQGSE